MTEHDIRTRPTILVVEDEAIVAITLKRALELAGYTVPKVVSRGAEVGAAVKELAPNFIVMDIRLADQVTGIEAAHSIRSFSDTPIVFVTGYPETKLSEEISRIPGAQLLTKPVPTSLVIDIIESELSSV